jgi:protein gp37
MADGTHIEWTDATWNPITGCSIVSPGCTNCYAMKLAGTRLKHTSSREGLTVESKAGPVWNGQVRLNKQWLDQPLRWKRPRRIFVCAHGDLFAENVPEEWIIEVFTVMAIADQHTFQVLTKRPDRARDFLSARFRLDDIYANWYTYSGSAREVQTWPLHNVWIGASAEDQKRYDQRRRYLEETPAALWFWSIEPMLGPIDLKIAHVKPDWIIVGGESGSNARPMHPDWVRSIRDQCAAAGTSFFFKQWGAWVSVSEVAGEGPHHNFDDGATVRRIGKKAAGRALDGVEHSKFPDLPEAPFQ